MADFVANLPPFNALADSSRGFVWRFQDVDRLTDMSIALWWDAAPHEPAENGARTYVRRTEFQVRPALIESFVTVFIPQR
jgi:Domain of unknown function (DUF3291)